MRYEWLDDRIDELVERYEAGQSLQDIADVFEVSKPTIHRRLQETAVEMRNGGPRHVHLEDRVDDLVEQYVERKQSLQAIADQYETSIAAVRFHLETTGIVCDEINPRTTDVGFDPFQLSIIAGELLGDGCLYRREVGSCIFQLSTTTRAHARRLMEQLPEKLFPESQYFTKRVKRTGCLVG